MCEVIGGTCTFSQRRIHIKVTRFSQQQIGDTQELSDGRSTQQHVHPTDQYFRDVDVVFCHRFSLKSFAMCTNYGC